MGRVQDAMRRAAEAGGSTIRDYRDGRGQAGGYARRHAVYGRADLPCIRCGRTLECLRILQRATVFCASCQTEGGGRLLPAGSRKEVSASSKDA